MSHPARRDVLLRAVCELLRPEEARRILGMDPESFLTLSEAYCAARLEPGFTPELKRAVVSAICALIEAEDEAMLYPEPSSPS